MERKYVWKSFMSGPEEEEEKKRPQVSKAEGDISVGSYQNHTLRNKSQKPKISLSFQKESFPLKAKS